MAIKSALNIGSFIYAPVTLYPTAREVKVSFNNLCKQTGERIRQKKYCPSCDRELEEDDIIKGYEFEKGRYVTFSKDELANLKSQRDSTIRIEYTTKMSEIDPLYYERNFYILPQTGAEETFDLIRQAMLAEKMVCVGRVVLTSEEEPVVLYPTKETIIAKFLYRDEEMLTMPKGLPKTSVSKEKLDVARTMVQSLYKKFDISAFVDGYRERILAAVKQKIEGKQIVMPKDMPIVNNVINIVDAMKKVTEMAKNNKRNKGTA